MLVRGHERVLRWLVVVFLGVAGGQFAAAQTAGRSFDVVHYAAAIRPDVETGSVSGHVDIQLRFLSDGVAAIEFDRGELAIDDVRYQGQRLTFELTPRRVRVVLPAKARRDATGEISVSYHGKPQAGLQFVPDRRLVYTIFSTSQWLVCVDAPEDKATLDLEVTLPAGLLAAGPGTLVSERPGTDGTVVRRWQLTQSVSTYLFGFAAGRFTEVVAAHGKIALHYLGEGVSRDELNRIFRETPEMIEFFTGRAGLPLPADAYTQVLVEKTAGQEAAGFSLLSDAYGQAVLKEPTGVSLIAHELAHQWWGNLVTCRQWTHFWLNEGFATFMAAAYDEHRFGADAYRQDIERARVRYEEVRRHGGDRSLVFPDWTRPSAADRTIVYQKGAYVLHLLREQMGDEAFWTGIKRYTTAHAGQSVTTDDLKRSMEASSGSNLGAFFEKWVYVRQ